MHVTPYIENLTTITILATIQNFVDTNNILKFVVVKVYSWLMSCHITGFIINACNTLYRKSHNHYYTGNYSKFCGYKQYS